MRRKRRVRHVEQRLLHRVIVRNDTAEKAARRAGNADDRLGNCAARNRFRASQRFAACGNPIDDRVRERLLIDTVDARADARAQIGFDRRDERVCGSAIGGLGHDLHVDLRGMREHGNFRVDEIAKERFDSAIDLRFGNADRMQRTREDRIAHAEALA